MSARRRYLIIHGLRWLPSGLLMPVFTLLPLQRGLTLSQAGVVFAAQGLAVLFVELPTGGLADAIGRRPVVLLSSAVGFGSLTLVFFADSVALFVVAFFLQGIYRALDSGPLESWYVDAALREDPEATIEAGLSAGGVVLGVAVAGGALLSGGLIALDPLPGVSALAVPILPALAFQVVYFVVSAVLLVESGPARGVTALARSVREVPSVIGAGVSLLRGSRVLLALICVELFWGFGMFSFESLTSVRLAEIVGGKDAAAAIMGPAWTAAWLVSALGAALAPLASRRLGMPLTAAAMHILQAVTVVGIALFAGPIGVLAAFLACYVIHGAVNPLYRALLHRQVDGPHRTTVLSMSSMATQPAGALGGMALGALAGAATVPIAILVGAVALALAAPLYLPAQRAATTAGRTAGTTELAGTGSPEPAVDLRSAM